MNLNSITEIKRPASVAEIKHWQDGYAWLAGGTWLFSEPQHATHTLIDLDQLQWLPLKASAAGLDIAATCRIAELYEFVGPCDRAAAPLLRQCCDAFLASFKIWNAATVGGNICMSLPASPMVSLAAALEATLTLWPRGAAPRELPAMAFVTGNHTNVLHPGELLRNIHLPARVLGKRAAFRHASMTKLGRSAALLVGTCSRHTNDDFVITITATTPRPVQLRFECVPGAGDLRQAIDAHIPADGYFDDVHGTPAYKRHLTYYFAEQIRAELVGSGRPAPAGELE